MREASSTGSFTTAACTLLIRIRVLRSEVNDQDEAEWALLLEG